jgi:hypothetical protein
MEDCLDADLGIFNDKHFVETKACELTVKEQFEAAPFNCKFSITNDGLEVGVMGAEIESPEYCLVHVSFLRVISFDFDKVAEDETEMWHFINDCLITYFFK